MRSTAGSEEATAASTPPADDGAEAHHQRRGIVAPVGRLLPRVAPRVLPRVLPRVMPKGRGVRFALHEAGKARTLAELREAVSCGLHTT